MLKLETVCLQKRDGRGRGGVKYEPIGNIYPIKVDYDATIETLVAAAECKYVDPAINDRNFATRREGSGWLLLWLVQVDRWTPTTQKILDELEGLGLRPAELHELLAFAGQYPELRLEEHPVVALGSTAMIPFGGGGAPWAVCLGHRGSGVERHDLTLVRADHGWSGVYWFAAVPLPRRVEENR